MARAIFRLTNQGRMKLAKVRKRVLTTLKWRLKEGTKEIVQPIIAQRAPKPLQEAIHISIGLITEPSNVGGRIGRTGLAGAIDERRFNKTMGHFWLKNAILLEPIIAQQKAGMIRIELGRLALYNPPNAPLSIGFSWRGGHQWRSTDDAEAGQGWKRLLQAWEFGGTIPVTPRSQSEGAHLEPERGVLAKRMTKTLPAFGMFNKGDAASRKYLSEFMNKKVKSTIAMEFGL